jgi:hypothetical protein
MIIRIVLAVAFLFLADNSFATDWYFDKDSIGGTCSDTGAGTIDHPFCSPFNKMYNGTVWNAPEPGDTIYLRAGTYTGNVFWWKEGTLNKGTETSPITIRPYPGETVTFDGITNQTVLIMVNTSDVIDGIHFVGPFNVVRYSHVAEGNQTAGGLFKKGWKFSNFNISDSATGFYLRTYGNLIVENITCTNLKFQKDHNICVGVRGYSGQNSYDVIIRDINASHIYDGKSEDERGDADGVWTDNYANNVLFENITVHDCEEDGVDTKAQNVIMRNVLSYNNGGSGIKLWGGAFGRASTYSLSNVAAYHNGETGIKCSGNGDIVNAVITNGTAYSNGEDNLKNVRGNDTSDACNITYKNMLVGGSTQQEVSLYVPYVDEDTIDSNFDHVNIIHGDNGYNAIETGCPALPGKYSLLQYTDGTYNSDMTAGIDCTSYYGDMSGSAISPTSFDPLIVSVPETFKFSSVATGLITGGTLNLALSANLVWPSPVIGEYIEINSDGVKRQITSVGSSGDPYINFTPSVLSDICGSSAGCIGTKVIGYGTSSGNVVTDLMLSASSPALDAGVFVPGIHCAQADDNGGSSLTGCVHWSGSAPELGFAYFGDYVPPPADTTKPIVTTFTIPSTAASLTVPITTFSATDNTAVTGYQITESSTAPVASGANWRVVAPSTYTCATQGSKTLYAWAKDAAGNVSLSMSTSVTITIAPPVGQGQARLDGPGHAKTDGPGSVILGN